MSAASRRTSTARPTTRRTWTSSTRARLENIARLSAVDAARKSPARTARWPRSGSSRAEPAERRPAPSVRRPSCMNRVPRCTRRAWPTTSSTPSIAASCGAATRRRGDGVADRDEVTDRTATRTSWASDRARSSSASARRWRARTRSARSARARLADALEPQAAQAPRVVGTDDASRQVEEVLLGVQLEAQPQAVALLQGVGPGDEHAAGAHVAREAVEPADPEAVAGSWRPAGRARCARRRGAAPRGGASGTTACRKCSRSSRTRPLRAGHRQQRAVGAVVARQGDDRRAPAVQEADGTAHSPDKASSAAPVDGADHDGLERRDLWDEDAHAFLAAPAEHDHLPGLIDRSDLELEAPLHAPDQCG